MLIAHVTADKRKQHGKHDGERQQDSSKLHRKHIRQVKGDERDRAGKNRFLE